LSLLLSTTGISETVNTGNILTNSTFGTGQTYSTDGWTVSDHTHGHNGTGSFATVGGGNNPGGSVAAEEDTVISQTVSLADDTDMLTEEIQSGWSSTLSADLWFWNQYDNTVILKQTITGSDGSTTVQQRIIEDTGCGSTNCGQFTNYTDTYIQGVNTQTDFDIGVSVSNTNSRSGHWGADIDDIELSVSYTQFNPITDEIQDDLDTIDDIDFDYEEIDFTIPEDIWTEDWTDFDVVFIEEEFFEEEFETIFLEEFEDFEEFEEAAFEELEVPEEFESFFSEEFTDEEMEILEEEFADEFEEFADEVMEEAIDEEPTEIATKEEEEIIEEETNEEKEVAAAEEETAEEEKITEDKNADITEEETKTEKAERVLEEDKEIDVAKTEDKKIKIDVVENVFVEVKEISLFDDGNKLAAYDNTDFYQPETIYSDVDNALFIQADLSIYNKGIYLNIGLDNYISTDPVGQHEQKIYDLKVQKLSVMIELQKLKDLL
tara:strand:+ start:10602 stop:12074 length:1473 start_codon:yes stop_codon:yes gene_type:complete